MALDFVPFGGIGGGGGGESLTATLAIGNLTGGFDIEVTTGDSVVSTSVTTGSAPPLQLFAGATTAVGPPGTGGLAHLRGGGGGTGTGGGVLLEAGTGGTADGIIEMRTGGLVRWSVTAAGNLETVTGGALDIGEVTQVNSPRTIYAATSVVVGTTVTIGSAAVTGSAALAVDAATALTIGTGTTTSLTIGRSGLAVAINGNVTVEGDVFSIDLETLQTRDNHIYLNKDYVTTSGQSGGLALNFLPTATTDTEAAGGFTSTTTVATAGISVFVAGDFVQVSGAANTANDGIYEVATHAANVLTITATPAHRFCGTTFVADATGSSAAFTQVNISVMQAKADGDWQVGKGDDQAALTASFADVFSGTVNLATVLSAGNTTGGTSLLVTSGDVIDSATGVPLVIGPTTATAVTVTAAGTPLNVTGRINVGTTALAVSQGDFAAGTATSTVFHEASASTFDVAGGAVTVLSTVSSTSGVAGRSGFQANADVGGTVVTAGVTAVSAAFTPVVVFLASSAVYASGPGADQGTTVAARNTTTASTSVSVGASLRFATSDTFRWYMTSAGHFLAAADTTYDIGGSGGGTLAERPRTIYVGTSVVVGDTVTISAAAVTGSAALAVNATGVLNLGTGGASTTVTVGRTGQAVAMPSRLNVGSTALAIADGDFAAGLTRTLAFDESAGTLGLLGLDTTLSGITVAGDVSGGTTRTVVTNAATAAGSVAQLTAVVASTIQVQLTAKVTGAFGTNVGQLGTASAVTAGLEIVTGSGASAPIKFGTSGALRWTIDGANGNLIATGAKSILTDGASALTIDAGGAAAVNVGTANANAVNIGNNTTNPPVSIDSGTGTISIGTGAQARAVNVGTGGAAQVVIVGSEDTTSSMTLRAGTGGFGIGTGTPVQTLNIGTGGTGAKTVVLGSLASTSTTTIQAGSGGVLQLGTFDVAGTVNGAFAGFKSSTEELTGLTGATVTTSGLIPAGVILLFVVARVTTTVTTSSGTNTFDIGDSGNGARYGLDIVGASGTTVDRPDFTADPQGTWSASGREIILDAFAAETFTAGAVRITAFYLDPTAPTS